MIRGITDRGDIKTVAMTEEGALKVAMEGDNITEINNPDTSPIPVKVMSGVSIPTEFGINNNNSNPVPVNITNTTEVETTLHSSVQTVSTTASSISVNKKVTSIDVANYSDTANITLTIGTLQVIVGKNIAVTLPINKTINNIFLVSTESDTSVQIIIKGVE